MRRKQLARRSGLRGHFSDQEVSSILSMYAERRSIGEIKAALGTPNNGGIHKVLKRHGILLRYNTGFEKATTHRATCHPTMGDLKWLAGFLEGEGSFHWQSEKWQRCSAFQLDREPLDRILAYVGGNIYPDGDGWQWVASGSRARGVMLTLYPLMSRRRKAQIRRAIGHEVAIKVA